MKSCFYCSFYSESHHACFHPEAWKRGSYFKEPGNPDVLNYDGKCAWYDAEMPEFVQSDGRGNRKKPICHNWVSRFFLRFRLAGLIGVPLMIGCRFAEFGSPLFYAGLVASFFLPLSVYGSCLALIQGRMPISMRSTIIGFTMLCLNVFALALGNLAAGAASDYLAARGHPAPLTTVLVVMDCVVGLSVVCFLAATRLIAAERFSQAADPEAFSG